MQYRHRTRGPIRAAGAKPTPITLSDGEPEMARRWPARDVSRRLMLRGIGGGIAAAAAAAFVLAFAAAARAEIQILDPLQPEEVIMAQTGVEALTGSWTYRSFVNDPTPGVPFGNLRFGEGELVIDDFAPGSFSGELKFGGTTSLRLTGSSSLGNPFAVRFQGVGSSPDIAEWVYDYVGYLAPNWPNGIEQRPAIVGSIVRTAPHDGNPAGVVASWIAVRRD